MASDRGFEEASPLLHSRDPHDGAQEASVEQERKGSDFELYTKVIATMFSFFTMGMFLSTLGALLPHIQDWYLINDAELSLILPAGPAAYVIAAQTNKLIHVHFGQRGIAIIGPILHLLFSLGGCLHPPFGVLLAGVAIGGAGSGILDGSFCAWACSTNKANLISGLMHAALSIGASIGPVLTGTLLSREARMWYEWYFVMVIISLVELIANCIAFRHESGERYRQGKQQEPMSSGRPADTRSYVGHRVTWLCALYLLVYVGAESAVSGWIAVFMKRARNASSMTSSLCSSAFWIGMTTGRVLLSFFTEWIGVRRAGIIYLVAATAMQLLFAAVDVPALSVVTIALLGLFCGPLFPSSIVLMASMLPKDTHVSATSFVAAAGQVGGAMFPFALGLMVQAMGIQIFEFTIVAQLIMTLILWIIFAKA